MLLKTSKRAKNAFFATFSKIRLQALIYYFKIASKFSAKFFHLHFSPKYSRKIKQNFTTNKPHKKLTIAENSQMQAQTPLEITRNLLATVFLQKTPVISGHQHPRKTHINN
jgi:hypothetical protein